MSTTPSRDLAVLNHPMPWHLWSCDDCGHTWWALRKETVCVECDSDQVFEMDHPEQPRCDVCHRDWRLFPVVGNGMCQVCRDGYKGD